VGGCRRAGGRIHPGACSARRRKQTRLGSGLGAVDPQRAARGFSCSGCRRGRRGPSVGGISAPSRAPGHSREAASRQARTRDFPGPPLAEPVKLAQVILRKAPVGLGVGTATASRARGRGGQGRKGLRSPPPRASTPGSVNRHTGNARRELKPCGSVRAAEGDAALVRLDGSEAGFGAACVAARWVSGLRAVPGTPHEATAGGERHVCHHEARVECRSTPPPRTRCESAPISGLFGGPATRVWCSERRGRRPS